ncbi:MAG: hypothetical protein IJL78_06840 [Lachnospiraceae bacterium]|nr:hypothetical protein [Lachnospiraceae bacterium]
MSTVFLKLLNLSLHAGWLILAVVLVRFFLKKAPRKVMCVLWALVALRLILPFSLESAFSLIPRGTVISNETVKIQAPAASEGETVRNDAAPVVNMKEASANVSEIREETARRTFTVRSLLPYGSILWLSGTGVLLLYALVSYLKLRKTVAASVPLETGGPENTGVRVMVCDEIRSPFILGIFRPVIYVPSSMSGEALRYVLSHETAHLKRLDHFWKPFGYLLLAVYWFQPLCWLAYILLCRDIEIACDEKVIRDMDREQMASYSQALLDCSMERRRIAACPVAFGEVGVKERVKNIISYKKPGFWIMLLAAVSCIIVSACFMTDPRTSGSAGNNPELSGPTAATPDRESEAPDQVSEPTADLIEPESESVDGFFDENDISSVIVFETDKEPSESEPGPAEEQSWRPKKGIYFNQNPDDGSRLISCIQFTSTGFESPNEGQWISSADAAISYALTGTYVTNGSNRATLSVNNYPGGEILIEFLSDTEFRVLHVDESFYEEERMGEFFWIHEGETYASDRMPGLWYYEPMSADDALKEARRANFPVVEGLQCTSGYETWRTFSTRVSRGEEASVIVVHYYTLDKDRVSPELYEEEKDLYPQLFISVIEYDGEEFTVSTRMSTEEKAESRETYRHLMHYTGKMPAGAVYSEYDYYVLVDDDSVTWEDIEHGLISSQSGDWIRHSVVFEDCH